MTASITFYGGAREVTGSNFLLDTGTERILIDCGAREREDICAVENQAPFAYDAKTINSLVITHAHQDHIGLVPKLVREGFSGVIYSTPATHDLSLIMLEDAVSLMSEEARRGGCAPLYSEDDVKKAFSLWRIHDYREPFNLGDTAVSFLDAGHILGSAMVKFERGGKTLIFTGDMGNSPEPLLRDTESSVGANYLVMESVYGDRKHEDADGRRGILHDAIERARSRGGTLLIPAFSLERTQVLLIEIKKLIAEGMKPIPVFLDAPLAARANEIFSHYTELLNPGAQKLFAQGGFTFSAFENVSFVSQSREIHDAPNPKVIIAGAGMSNGGRIRVHELRYLPDPKAEVMLTGFQAPGSLGRRIQSGEKRVHMNGQDVAIQATISSLGGYSGHKDVDGLVAFVEPAVPTLTKVFVVMGEPKASLFLAQRLKDFLGVSAEVPELLQTATIDF